MGRYIAPVLIGVVGVAILVALGIWQVQRLAWKEGVLADMDARMTGDPVALPDVVDREEHSLLSVKVAGRITDEELHVLTTANGGPAFRVITAFETEDGRRLLLDRGLVDDSAKEAPRAPVEATVVGNIHWPDEKDSWTPDPDLGKNIWYVRDVDMMSAELATEEFMLITRRTTEAEPPVTPAPVNTAGVPNDHLQYAITWFSLALVWIGMTLYWILRIRRGPEGTA
ncbi:MAG: SURF1 family protein [Pseudomonadota bacterium]